ncbi:high-potential iron-sulfur protein [Membranihabitans maritimus]|uniref:high-potential iron-sulfur protein n=1 Tax=Membranihabitans maritimus TaxID=2904244 RepID=UPI001F2FF0E7|nr:high-potential iron-sulfur protein [Membranihabitans maritimus]
MSDIKNRRKFLQLAIMGSTSVVAGAFLTTGCSDEKKEESEEEIDTLDVESCDDLSKVGEADLKKRKSLGYEETTPIPDKHCSNCQLYIPPKEGRNCGGCILFKGPVFEDGYCTYWAPQAG